MNEQQRFEKKFFVTPGCWIWTAAKSKTGYGRFLYGGKNRLAHRLSYSFYIGEIPDGMLVCHKCDNPSCVNPDHFFIGTNDDNMIDMSKKGRAKGGVVRGEEHGYTKLKNSHILAIREACDFGVEQQWLADFFSVTQKTISNIYRRKTWGHV